MKYILISLLLSCASTKKEEASWINQAPNIEGKICAVGEGSSYSRSDIKAKVALKGIFETKVSSNSAFSKRLGEDQKIESSQSIEVTQSVRGILEGASIEKRVTNNKLNYSLACLSKAYLQSNITSKIKLLDAELEELEAIGSAWNIKKAKGLLVRRNTLAQSLELADGFVSSAPVDFEEINNWRSKSDLNKRIHLIFSSDYPKGLQGSLNDQIHSLGFRLASSIKEANSFIRASYEVSKDYYKAKGFDKYRVLISLRGIDKFNIQQGSFSKEFVVIVRDESQVYESVEKDIKEYINDHLADLKL